MDNNNFKIIIINNISFKIVGVGFGCPNGLTWPNPNKWENRGTVSGSFKTTQKLPLLKKFFFFILSVRSLSALPLKNQRENMFSLLSRKTKMKNAFSFLSWNKQERIWFFWRKKSFIVKLSLSFSMERRSRLLCYEKRMFLIFVVPFMTWVDKFGKWNNQFGSWGILEGNREALLFNIGIRALLGCFLPFIFILFVFLYFYVFQRK